MTSPAAAKLRQPLSRRPPTPPKSVDEFREIVMGRTVNIDRAAELLAFSSPEDERGHVLYHQLWLELGTGTEAIGFADGRTEPGTDPYVMQDIRVEIDTMGTIELVDLEERDARRPAEDSPMDATWVPPEAYTYALERIAPVMGLKVKRSGKPQPGKPPVPRLAEISGTLDIQVPATLVGHRVDFKKMRAQRLPDGKGYWTYSTPGNKKVLEAFVGAHCACFELPEGVLITNFDRAVYFFAHVTLDDDMQITRIALPFSLAKSGQGVPQRVPPLIRNEVTERLRMMLKDTN